MNRSTSRWSHPNPARARRGFTLVELLLVVGIVALFALLVVPGLASAGVAPAGPVARILEADLRRARTEAIARALPVSLVASADGRAWWLAVEPAVDVALEGTFREFGRGALVDYAGNRMMLAPRENTSESPRIARFDAFGARDEGIPTISLRTDDGEEVGCWVLPAGRSRLAPTAANTPSAAHIP